MTHRHRSPGGLRRSPIAQPGWVVGSTRLGSSGWLGTGIGSGRCSPATPLEAVCLDGLVQIRHTAVLVATTRNGSTTITPTGRCAVQVAAGPRRNRRAYRDPHRRRHLRGPLRRHRLPRRTRLGPSARRGVHRGWLSAMGRGREDHPCAPIRHDRATEHGAFATPTDDPANPTPSPSSRNNPSASYRHQNVAPVPELDTHCASPVDAVTDRRFASDRGVSALECEEVPVCLGRFLCGGVGGSRRSRVAAGITGGRAPGQPLCGHQRQDQLETSLSRRFAARHPPAALS